MVVVPLVTFSTPPLPQAPPEHCVPVAQTLPQTPQFELSMVVFVHAAEAPDPHAVRPGAQLQLLAAQDAPEGQVLPQLPQLALSFAVSTQVAPQRVEPLRHAAQAPPEQISPAGQALPQVPQLPTSLVRSKHPGLPVQTDVGGVHGAWHCPALQMSPVAHR
jgi:hypothetical protein